MTISVFDRIEKFQGKGEQMLVASIFSFFQNVFKRLPSFGSKNHRLFENELNGEGSLQFLYPLHQIYKDGKGTPGT